jgi:hypothetical protein
VILACQTGRGVLVGSGAIEDDFLVFGKSAHLALEILKGNGSLQTHAPTSFLAVISTYQKTIT